MLTKSAESLCNTGAPLSPSYSDLKSKLFHGVTWNLLGMIVSASSAFIGSIIAARLLGIELYGYFEMIKSTIGTFTSIAGLGLGITCTKYISELKNIDKLRLGRIIGLCSVTATFTSLVFTCLFIALVPLIALYGLKSPQITIQLYIVSVYLAFSTFNGYQVGALVGFENFSKLAKINFYQGVISIITTFVFTWYLSLTGSCIAITLSAVLNWFFYYKALISECRSNNIFVQYENCLSEKKILTSFSIPAAISGIIGSCSIWGGVTLLVQNSEGNRQLAIFSAANSFRTIIMFFPTLFVRVLSPILCNLTGCQDYKGVNYFFQINLYLTTVVTIILAVIFSLLSPYLLAIFGKEFIDGQSVIAILSMSAVAEVIATSYYQKLYVNGLIWDQVIVILCWSVTLIGISFIGVKPLGALGLGYAYLVAHIVSAVCYIAFTRKSLNVM